MKKKNILLCLVFGMAGLLGGCSNGRTLQVSEAEAMMLNLQQDSEDFVAGEDDWYSYTNLNRLYCGAENLTFYIFGEVLSVTDGSDEAVMCNLRACTHSDESCMAYTGHLNPVYVASYMDCLYLVDAQEDGLYSLYRFEVGSSEKYEAYATQRDYLTAVSIDAKATPEFMVHRGYIYYTAGKELYRLELNPNAEPVKIYEGAAALSDLHAYGNGIFFCDGNGAVYRGELPEAEEWEFVTLATGTGGYAVWGTKLYYLSDSCFVMCDNMQSGKTVGEPECVYTSENAIVQSVYCDGNYLIADEVDEEGAHTIVILEDEFYRLDISNTSMNGALCGIYPLTEQVILENNGEWIGVSISEYLESSKRMYMNIGYLAE